MKKIININLSGRVIPIEDSAYEKLQGYIESLRRFFAKEEGRDEIINDIESRIAELMNEKVRKGSEAVTEADMDEFISSIGRPEELEAADPDTLGGSYNSQAGAGAESIGEEPYTSPGRMKGRLYRDSSDKILGGVCAGIANYLNVDPAIVRLLFAIITFGGFGAGILLYILLWVILPARDLDTYEGKRLYRDPEDRILGGVASGLAAYFRREPWTIRLIFLAPFILNIIVSIFSWGFMSMGGFFPNIVFGTLTGTFLLAYIVLWIVLPEARSTYQRMEMRGEKVNLEAIRQNVKDRAREVGEDVKAAASTLTGKARAFAQGRGKGLATEAGEVARRTGYGLGRVIGVLFKIFFLFIAGSIAFGLFILLMVLLFGGMSIWPLKNYILEGVWQNAFAWGTMILFLGVPLVAFITWIVRRIMKVRSKDSYLGWTFGGLWTLGWICLSFFVASLFNSVRSTDRKQQELEVIQPVNDRLLVKVSEPAIIYTGNFWWFDTENEGWDIREDSMKLSNVKIRIQKSPDSNYHVFVNKYAAGKNLREASEKASRIQFMVNNYDSVLDLGSGFAISKDDKFRFQRVAIVIQVPAGKLIRFDESLDRHHPLRIRMHENRRWRSRDWDSEWDWDSYFDWKMNVDYRMNEFGELVNTNPSAPSRNPNRDNYRYDSPARDSIEEKKRRLEEELRRLEELQGSTGFVPKKENKQERIVELAAARSPLFSLVTM